MTEKIAVIGMGQVGSAMACACHRARPHHQNADAVSLRLARIALAGGFRGQDIVALLSMYQNWAGGATK
jgi:3-hydroxyisobutyrate dehydrogenase-like beta-hydroxyacid dehydrogenase